MSSNNDNFSWLPSSKEAKAYDLTPTIVDDSIEIRASTTKEQETLVSCCPEEDQDEGSLDVNEVGATVDEEVAFSPVVSQVSCESDPLNLLTDFKRLFITNAQGQRYLMSIIVVREPDSCCTKVFYLAPMKRRVLLSFDVPDGWVPSCDLISQFAPETPGRKELHYESL